MTVRVSILPNGLRVVTQRMDSVETVSLGVWVATGARFETTEINGASHFLEHMAFKGTDRRSARDIAEQIEDVGGHLNAYTSREQTAYHATVLKEDVPLGIDIISDILLNSRFDPVELDRERAVILQEIGQANDTPDDIIFDRFQEAAFPGQPVGRPVLGTAEIVGAMTRDTLTGYMVAQYTAPRMVLAAAGNLEHDRVAALAQDAFGGVRAGQGTAPVPASYRGGDYRENRDLEQVHLILGFEGMPYNDPDYYAFSVLSTLLGGGMSSRLFQEVREVRGLAYSIYTFGASYVDTGVFGVYAGTGEREAPELVDVLCDELLKSCDPVPENELRRARAQIKAGVLMSLESTASRCEQLARQMHVYGRPLELDEIAAKIDAVDEAAVRKVAQRVFRSKPTVAALGPISGVEDYGAIETRLAN